MSGNIDNEPGQPRGWPADRNAPGRRARHADGDRALRARKRAVGAAPGDAHPVRRKLGAQMAGALARRWDHRAIRKRIPTKGRRAREGARDRRAGHAAQLPLPARAGGRRRDLAHGGGPSATARLSPVRVRRAPRRTVVRSPARCVSQRCGRARVRMATCCPRGIAISCRRRGIAFIDQAAQLARSGCPSLWG